MFVQLYLNQRVLTINSNGLNIPITNSGCPSCMFFVTYFCLVLLIFYAACNNVAVVSAGLNSLNTYDYGRFDFNLKFANTVSIPFTITWQSSSFGNGYISSFKLLYSILTCSPATDCKLRFTLTPRRWLFKDGKTVPDTPGPKLTYVSESFKY